MKFSLVMDSTIEAAIEKLPFRELIAHVCCPDFSTAALPDRDFGAIFLHGGDREETRNALRRYSAGLPEPPLVAADLECDAGKSFPGCTEFPFPLGLGRGSGSINSYRAGCATAQEGLNMGINWSLGPCCDILADCDNPVASINTFGTDTETVIREAGAFLRGLQENGMAGTAKHFPGGGHSREDPHLTVAVNPLSAAEWEAQSGAVFEHLIAAGVMAVMPGHVALPAMDRENSDRWGRPVPATLSRGLLTGLLKRKLGFSGLIVSDAVSMGGFCGFENYYDACVHFLTAGGDCLLFVHPDERFCAEMETRLDAGMMTLELLRDRAMRVLAFRREAVRRAAARTGAKINQAEHAKWAELAAREAIETVRDREKLLPVQPVLEKKILHVIITPDQGKEQESVFSALTAGLRQFAPTTEAIDPGPAYLDEAIASGHYSLVVCSMDNSPRWGVGSIRMAGFHARNMMGRWPRLGVPIVWVVHGHPYVHREFDATMDTVINTYGTTPAGIPVLLELMFGKKHVG